jgi:uncharacterized membrane protein
MDRPMRRQGSLSIAGLTVAAATALFACAAAHHALYRTGFDLSIFDQAVYLISKHELPVSSIRGLPHILADHAAYVLYALALVYRLHASAYWLLLIQAASLAFGAWPVWRLSKVAGLPDETARAMAVAYLLYPVAFNANLNDFHPEVIAVPALLLATLAARRRQLYCCLLWAIVVVSCKSILGLTLVGLGAWLFVSEQRAYGGAVAAIGLGGFLVAVLVVVPHFSGTGAADTEIGRYAYLGSSVAEIVWHLAVRPDLWVPRLVSGSSLGYLIGLALPVAWGIRPGCLAPLLGAAPAVLLNVLAEDRLQRHLTNQYSLPAFPFLIMAAMCAIVRRKAWLSSPRAIIVWAAIGFLAYGNSAKLFRSVQTNGTWCATREALRQIGPSAGVLTNGCLAAHLAHRRGVYLLQQPYATNRIPADVQFIVLSLRSPCSDETAQHDEASLSDNLKASGAFRVVYERDGVLVFARN